MICSLRTFTGALLVLSTVPSYILILTPAREHIENLTLKFTANISPFQDMIVRNVLRTVLVFSTAFIALRDPMFGSALGAVGGLTDAFQSFILPSMIFLLVNRSKEIGISVWQKCFYSSVSGWGITVVFYTFIEILIDVKFEVHYFLICFVVSTFLVFSTINSLISYYED